MREAGGTDTKQPAVYIQPQMQITLEDTLKDGTGRVKISCSVGLCKSYNWSSSTYTPTYVIRDASVSTDTSGTLNRTRTIEGLSTDWTSNNSFKTSTFYLDPGGQVDRTGTVNLCRGSSTASSTISLSTPVITILSPVSTSSKMTMTFKTSRSSVSGQAT